jgi:hypothetical protein
MKKLFEVLCVLLVSSASFAGFVDQTFLCTFPDDPSGSHHVWSFNYTEDFLSLQEHIHALGFDQVTMSGATDEDPIFRATKYVTNETAVAWTSYELTLAPSGPLFIPTPSSDLFTSAVISNGGLKITYSGGVVNPGDEVQLNFKVQVFTTGGFSTCLTQNPIPEPATMSMLALGALALIRRKK